MASALAPTRTRKKQNYHSSRTIWTKEEDDLLMKLAQSCTSISWSGISKYFPAKTAPQLAGRWEKVLNPKLVKGSWTREEDEAILAFVQSNGDKDWSKLAVILNGRTGKQCRERFRNHLDPNLSKTAWTVEEDQMLVDLHARFGNSWTKISSFFNGRTDNSIKNRWNSTIKKRLDRIEKGEPLVMKRGRKPKNYSVNVPSCVTTLTDNRSSQCSSPISVPTTPEFVPLADQFTLNLPFYIKKESTVCSLEQNRLELNRLLKSVTA